MRESAQLDVDIQGADHLERGPALLARPVGRAVDHELRFDLRRRRHALIPGRAARSALGIDRSRGLQVNGAGAGDVVCASGGTDLLAPPRAMVNAGVALCQA